ncbi:MAG: response regulator transcription factor [Bryobacterales bacterium]|nr:response regulator transcription factor [Bryobacterales bacterium]
MMESQEKIGILLVEDHQLVRQSLRAILERESDFHVMGDVDGGRAAIAFCRERAPGVVLMDVSMPDLNGIDAAAEITRVCPGARILMLSAYDDEASVMSAMASGVRGYVLKNAPLAHLVQAIRHVYRDGYHTQGHLSERLVNRLQDGSRRQAAAKPKPLSPRESEVLQLVVAGKSSKEIATAMELSLETVRSYRKSVMKKLRANNVADLTRIALGSELAAPALAAAG